MGPVSSADSPAAPNVRCMQVTRCRVMGFALIACLGCGGDRPAVDSAIKSVPEQRAAPAPVDAGVALAAAPPPDFDGNWFVLQPDQTLEQFSESIGVPVEVIQTRATQVDWRWLSQLERDIETRFPEV